MDDPFASYVLEMEWDVEQILLENPYKRRVEYANKRSLGREYWIDRLKLIDRFHLGDSEAGEELQKILNKAKVHEMGPFQRLVDIHTPKPPDKNLNREDIASTFANFRNGLESPNEEQRQRFEKFRDWYNEHIAELPVLHEPLFAVLEQAKLQKGRKSITALDEDLEVLCLCKIDYLSGNSPSILGSVSKFASDAIGNSLEANIDRLRKKLSTKIGLRPWI